MTIKKLSWVKVPMLVGTVCLAAACSSGGGNSASSDGGSVGTDQATTAPAASTDTTAASGGASASADQATATAINLTQADLAGWTSTPADNSSDPIGAQLAKCAGAPDPSTIKSAEVASPGFSQDNAQVSSDVTMVKTAADGQADLQAFESSKMAGCVQTVAVPYLQKQMPSGATIGTVTFTPQAAPAGIPDSFSFRIVVPVTVPNQGTATINSDVLGILVGRAEVELDSSNTNAVPDAAQESKLINLLYTRAKAQPGTA